MCERQNSNHVNFEIELKYNLFISTYLFDYILYYLFVKFIC